MNKICGFPSQLIQSTLFVCSVLSHVDDTVLAFFNTIAENWLKQDVLLTLKFHPLNNRNNNQLVRTANYGQFKALIQLLNNRVSGLDDGEMNAVSHAILVIPYLIVKITFANFEMNQKFLKKTLKLKIFLFTQNFNLSRFSHSPNLFSMTCLLSNSF